MVSKYRDRWWKDKGKLVACEYLLLRSFSRQRHCSLPKHCYCKMNGLHNLDLHTLTLRYHANDTLHSFLRLHGSYQTDHLAAFSPYCVFGDHSKSSDQMITPFTQTKACAGVRPSRAESCVSVSWANTGKLQGHEPRDLKPPAKTSR